VDSDWKKLQMEKTSGFYQRAFLVWQKVEVTTTQLRIYIPV